MKRSLSIAIVGAALLGLAAGSAEAAAPVSAGLATKTTQAGQSAVEQVAYRCWRSNGRRLCRSYPSYAYRYYDYDYGPSYYYGSPYRYRYYRSPGVGIRGPGFGLSIGAW